MNARPGLLAALALAFALEAGPAAAADRPCTCLAQGRAFELGQRVCLQLPEGPRMAECRMVQNVTSWKVEDDGCVVSRLEGKAISRLLAQLAPAPGPMPPRSSASAPP